MADTFSTSLRLQLQATGGNSSTWGSIADTQYNLLEAAITGDNGYAGGSGGISVAGLTTYSLTVNQGTADQARQLLYPFVGALTGDCTVSIPGVVKIGWALNATTGGHNVILKVGIGTTLTIASGQGWTLFYCDGVNVTTPSLYLGTQTNGAYSGNLTVGGTLGVTGNATLSGTLAVTGAITQNGTQVVYDSGTWGINITGGAANATSAGSAGGLYGTPNINVNDLYVNGAVYVAAGIQYTDLGGTHFYKTRWDGTNLYIYVDSTPFQLSIVSDATRKRNIAPSRFDALAAVNAVAISEFDMKSGPEETQKWLHFPCGIVAQDIEKHIPQSTIHPDLEGAAIQLSLSPILSAALRAIQQLSTKIDLLERALEDAASR